MYKHVLLHGIALRLRYGDNKDVGQTFITFAEGAGISDFAYWQNLNTLGMSSTLNLSFKPLSTISKKRAYNVILITFRKYVRDRHSTTREYVNEDDSPF